MREFVFAGMVTALAAQANDTPSLSTLKLSFDRPRSAMRLPPTLMGLSMEFDRFPDWTGSLSSPNNFTYALLDNLKTRTGVPPPFRIGGGSQDHAIYTPSVEYNENIYPHVPNNYTNTKQLFPEASYVAIGKDTYLLSGNLPSGTHFTWGVNYKSFNTSEVLVQVKEIRDAFSDPSLSDQTLDYLAIGNEIDGPGKSIWDYINQTTIYIQAINSKLGPGAPFQLGDFAAYWSTTSLLNAGIDSSAISKYIGAFSEHHYQNGPNPTKKIVDIASQLINKDFIRGNISRYTASAMSAHITGHPFYLSETNTFYGHGQAGVSNTAAAALWVIDYSLQAAVNGVDGLYYHNGIGYNYSICFPLDHLGKNISDYDPDTRRHALPFYSGFVAVADAIGSSGQAFVSEMWTDNKTLAAYGIWEQNDLQRIMLINSVPWSTSSTGQRPVLAVQFPDLIGRQVSAKKLSFSNLQAQSGVVWGGQNWDGYYGETEGEESRTYLDSKGTIYLEASSAALLYL